jgi:hypothetical protein
MDKIRSAVSDPSRFDFRNAWYAVLQSELLTKKEPYGFQLLGDPIVLFVLKLNFRSLTRGANLPPHVDGPDRFRDEKGAAQTVIDKCPHRSAPLSVGQMRDNRLEWFVVRFWKSLPILFLTLFPFLLQ